jgi:hypothetical protein
MDKAILLNLIHVDDEEFKEKNIVKKFREKIWPEANELIRPFELYIEGVPLAANFQNALFLIQSRNAISDLLQSANVDNFVLSKLLEFVQGICQKIIRPRLELSKGVELFQLINDFWERY